MTMITADDQIRIERLEALLRGEAVDGLKLGDPGLSEDWARSELAELRGAPSCLTCKDSDCLGDYTHFEGA
jgi:hypothetical protein